MTERQDKRRDFLKLEETLWRVGAWSVVRTVELGERERAAEEGRRGIRYEQVLRQVKPEPLKAKVLTTEQLRQAAIHTLRKLAASWRRSCRVIDMTGTLFTTADLFETMMRCGCRAYR